jgi:hypothetical protein
MPSLYPQTLAYKLRRIRENFDLTEAEMGEGVEVVRFEPRTPYPGNDLAV